MTVCACAHVIRTLIKMIVPATVQLVAPDVDVRETIHIIMEMMLTMVMVMVMVMVIDGNRDDDEGLLSFIKTRRYSPLRGLYF